MKCCFCEVEFIKGTFGSALCPSCQQSPAPTSNRPRCQGHTWSTTRIRGYHNRHACQKLASRIKRSTDGTYEFTCVWHARGEFALKLALLPAPEPKPSA